MAKILLASSLVGLEDDVIIVRRVVGTSFDSMLLYRIQDLL